MSQDARSAANCARTGEACRNRGCGDACEEFSGDRGHAVAAARLFPDADLVSYVTDFYGPAMGVMSEDIFNDAPEYGSSGFADSIRRSLTRELDGLIQDGKYAADSMTAPGEDERPPLDGGRKRRNGPSVAGGSDSAALETENRRLREALEKIAALGQAPSWEVAHDALN